MEQLAAGLVLVDRYVLARPLGSGGAGAVWAAHDRVLDRTVAVKVVPAGVEASRLEREARAAAGVTVPNVVAVYDHGRQDDHHFLVMELVDGVDLGRLLEVAAPLSPGLVALVGRDLARGLAAVHRAGIVHRDVSPSNVLVSSDGVVKLADLGIAQRAGSEATRRLTEVGTVVGTVDYLAPEQVDDAPVSPATDVYALGLVLHAASTGAAPFGDGSVSERLARRVAGTPPRLEGQLGEVLARATASAPTDRFPDGETLLGAFAPLLPVDESPVRAELATLVDRARRPADVAPADSTVVVPVGDAETHGTTGPVPPVPPVGGSEDATTTIATVPADEVPAADERPAARAATREQPAVATPAAVPGSGAPSTPDEGPGEASGDPDGLPALVRPVAASIAVVVAVIALVSGLGGDDGGEDGGDGAAEAAATALPITAAVDHDPLGGGDEHPEDVPLAIDGDPGTAWDTEGYDSRDLGGLKDGVGLLLDLGAVVDVAAVEVTMGTSGADLVVTVSEDRPTGDPTASATTLGTAAGTSGTVTVEGDPVAGRWVALWFTALDDDGGRHRAVVNEVRVLGG